MSSSDLISEMVPHPFDLSAVIELGQDLSHGRKHATVGAGEGGGGGFSPAASSRNSPWFWDNPFVSTLPNFG